MPLSLHNAFHTGIKPEPDFCISAIKSAAVAIVALAVAFQRYLSILLEFCDEQSVIHAIVVLHVQTPIEILLEIADCIGLFSCISAISIDSNASKVDSAVTVLTVNAAFSCTRDNASLVHL